MIRPRARRDFLLDSGALSHLASSEPRAIAWFAHIKSDYDSPSVFVPVFNAGEALTGDPRRDARTNRLLRRLEDSSASGGIYLMPTMVTMTRAAALRTRAITSGVTSAKRPISLADAQLVALAEERSTINDVTILTGDAADIRMLVDLTGATNIAVQVV